jgi:hypothetical protein
MTRFSVGIIFQNKNVLCKLANTWHYIYISKCEHKLFYEKVEKYWQMCRFTFFFLIFLISG